MLFSSMWVTPSGLLPRSRHQTMTSVLVWDTGRPNGDQRHPLVPVGPVVRSTAATCLAAAVACPHYGPNTTTSISMGERYIYSACMSNQMALRTRIKSSGQSGPVSSIIPTVMMMIILHYCVVHVHVYVYYIETWHTQTNRLTTQRYIKSTTYYTLRHKLIAVRRAGAPWPGWLWEWNEPGPY